MKMGKKLSSVIRITLVAEGGGGFIAIGIPVLPTL